MNEADIKALDAAATLLPQIELWFFRDIDDEARRKLIALCLGEGVAKEAKFHDWQRKCLRRILSRTDKLAPVDGDVRASHIATAIRAAGEPK